MATPSDSPQPVDVADVLNELRDRVARRRADGEYPADLEDRLERQFSRSRPAVEVDHLVTLRIELNQLGDRSHFTTDRIPLTSSSRFGEHYHRMIGQAIGRQVAGALEQVQEFADVLRPLLEHSVDKLTDLDRFVHDVESELHAGLDELDSRRTAGHDLIGELAALRARVAVLEGEQSLRVPFDERALQERFEGSQAELMDRARHVGELIGHRAPVLDLACGQGGLLEVLAERRVDAEGVDVRSGLVAQALQRGLPARNADPLVAVTEAADASLGAVILADGVEHLAPQTLVDLISAAASKLTNDGVLILAADNPAAVLDAARRAGSDPRRRGPIGPEYLSFVCTQAGFARCDLYWTAAPTGPFATIDGPAAELAGRLREVLYPPARFLLVAGQAGVQDHIDG